MAQEQNYQVNYSINVDASQGTKQVIAFGEAVGKLVQAKASLTPSHEHQEYDGRDRPRVPHQERQET
ncbi:hypothetical protein NXV13_10525 [Bacteroides ovatus]|nr:hypothetical protein [Bacteroides ovatus]